MKELSLEKMEKVQGGGWFGCTVGIVGGVVGIIGMNPVVSVIGIAIASEEC